MKRFTIMLAVTVAADLTLAGCTERPHADLEQRYVPLSRLTETWGMLRLSRTSAQIAAFAGSMRLEHAGVMSTSVGSDLSGAEVFRIVHAEDYFARNMGRNAFCAELPRWLAVRHASSDARTAGEIWVALLTVKDWDAYRPDVPGYCAGGLYAPEAGTG